MNLNFKAKSDHFVLCSLINISLGWGEREKTFLRATSAPLTQNNISSWKRGSRGFVYLGGFWVRVFWYCLLVCFVTVDNQLPPRKRRCCDRPHTATLVSAVNNSSVISLRCLAEPKQLWHWIWMKKNSTAGKNNPLEMAALWKNPSAWRCPWITRYYAGHRATNTQSFWKQIGYA